MVALPDDDLPAIKSMRKWDHVPYRYSRITHADFFYYFFLEMAKNAALFGGSHM